MGYQLKILADKSQNIKEELICIICHLILRAPILGLPCGHYLCKACYDKLESELLKCSRCEENGKEDHCFDKSKGARSYNMERKLEKLQVKCKIENCVWEGYLMDYDNHIKDCNCVSSGEEVSVITGSEQCTDVTTTLKLLEQKMEKMNQNFERSILILQERIKINSNNIEILMHQAMSANFEREKYYGNFTWRIDNVDKRIEESKQLNGQVTSPVFFTSQGGYKLCARIYFNGHEEFQGTHISFYIIILKGEFDNILTWPFNQEIKVQLLCQNSREFYEKIITPDLQSSSSMKPVAIGNSPMGMKDFIVLDDFNRSKHRFIKDNIIFFRVSVLGCGEV